MKLSIRKDIQRRIKERKDIWREILLLQYVLILVDRISHSPDTEQRVSGIWGHSYVRTYFNWVGTPPKKRGEMEGGIATSYFVLRSLSSFFDCANQPIYNDIVLDVSKFIKSRTDKDGAVGIKSIDLRGIDTIHANIRHSCFAYLILDTLCPLGKRDEHYEEAMKKIAHFLLKQRNRSDLVHEIMKESWPIGGIASYIASMNTILRNGHTAGLSDSEVRRISASARCLLELVAEIDTKHLILLGLSDDSFGNNIRNLYPSWYPIKGLTVLKLHSTLGCLNLIGTQLVQVDNGFERISEIINAFHKEMYENDGAPRFSSNSPASISAAIAMLTILLEKWYEPNDCDAELIDKLLSFIENKSFDPMVYQDYWSEFVSPLLGLSDICCPLRDVFQIIEADGIKIYREIILNNKMNYKSIIPSRDFSTSIRNILSSALGFDLFNK